MLRVYRKTHLIVGWAGLCERTAWPRRIIFPAGQAVENNGRQQAEIVDKIDPPLWFATAWRDTTHHDHGFWHVAKFSGVVTARERRQRSRESANIYYKQTDSFRPVCGFDDCGFRLSSVTRLTELCQPQEIVFTNRPMRPLCTPRREPARAQHRSDALDFPDARQGATICGQNRPRSSSAGIPPADCIRAGRPKEATQ